jgi:hypothetical protein
MSLLFELVDTGATETVGRLRLPLAAGFDHFDPGAV